MNDLTLVTVSNDPGRLGSLLEWTRRSGCFKAILACADATGARAEETYRVARQLADRAV